MAGYDIYDTDELRTCGDCHWWVPCTRRGARELAEMVGEAAEPVDGITLAAWGELQHATERAALRGLGCCARRTEPRLAASEGCDRWEAEFS